MEVVKFKNGKFGVRRYGFFGYGYEFAINKSGSWSPKSSKLVQEFNSELFAEEVLEHVRGIQERDSDMGVSRWNS
jgi:hypothetical protein